MNEPTVVYRNNFFTILVYNTDTMIWPAFLCLCLCDEGSSMGLVALPQKMSEIWHSNL